MQAGTHRAMQACREESHDACVGTGYAIGLWLKLGRLWSWPAVGPWLRAGPLGLMLGCVGPRPRLKNWVLGLDQNK